MTLLSPAYAAALADGVYDVNKNPRMDPNDRAMLLRCEPDFSIGRPADAGLFARGTSGAPPGGFALLGAVPGGQAIIDMFSPVASDFGYVGIGNRLWQDHMIIVTRGTMGAQGVSNDWISNYNVGLQPGPSGLPVHAGFNRIWGGFRAFILEAVQRYRPDHIHCVGHSLGGALASLNAELLIDRGHAVTLYTFGAPRVGTLPFATKLSVALRGRIKRVYHPADPVPMIPLLPFLHAPLSSGIRLSSSPGSLVDPSAHDMVQSYEAGVIGKSWAQLEAAHTSFNDFQVDSWLQKAAKQRGGYIMRSAALLERISRGLSRLVQKAAIYVIGSGLSSAATATLTALDFIAWLLARAAELGETIRAEIDGLVNAIFGFLGRVGNSVVTLTRAALRWVLDLLYGFLAGTASNAMDRLRRW